MNKLGWGLVVIIIIGIIPRIIELLSKNYLFGFDQGLFFQAVSNIVIDKRVILIGAEVGGIGGFFQGPGWYYLLSVPFILFSGDPYGAMILMFLFGVVSIILSIVLFDKLIGRNAALLSGLFMAMAPGIIAQSRFIWPPFVITPLTVIYLFCIKKTYDGHSKYIPFIFLTLGVMTHFEIATGMSLLGVTILTLLILRPKKIFNYKIILLSICAFLLTQVTLILFDIRHNFIGLKGIISYLTHGAAQAPVSYSLRNHLDMYKDAFLSVSLTWYMASIFATVIAVSIYKILKSKKQKQDKKFILFLLLCPTILFLAFLPLKTTLWTWWFLELPVFLCFLLGISFSYLLSRSRLKYFAILLLVIVGGFYINQTYFWYRTDFPDFGGVAKIKGKVEAIDYIYKDAGNKEFGVFVFTPPVYTYAYDYTFAWYGGKKYGYIPPHEKKETFYLLMEKDPEKPTSYKGWMETVIKDGKVIKTVTLPKSGFIIQKRSTR